ncbi:MAG: TlpA family protein disulfide reductase [Candidatus Krumholzibacteriota bacterium]|nr:TlpA family protein disulfide reductase [Candidatus Krumholzibacteriota bacterium]
MSIRRSLPLLAAALLLVAGGAAAAPKKLPPVSVTDLAGERIKVNDLLAGGEGPMLINFWATWCKPCLAEMPKLAEFAAEWEAAGLRVISISIDDPRSQKQVKPFVSRHKIAFPVYLDPNQEAHRKLGGRAVPYNVLVSAAGEVLRCSAGYRAKDAEAWAELIRADLEQRAAGEGAPAAADTAAADADRGEAAEEAND